MVKARMGVLGLILIIYLVYLTLLLEQLIKTLSFFKLMQPTQ